MEARSKHNRALEEEDSDPCPLEAATREEGSAEGSPTMGESSFSSYGANLGIDATTTIGTPGAGDIAVPFSPSSSLFSRGAVGIPRRPIRAFSPPGSSGSEWG